MREVFLKMPILMGAQEISPLYKDGPSSPLFEPLDIPGNMDLSKIDASMVSGQMADAAKSAPIGKSVAWGIPFNIGKTNYLS